MFDSKFNHEARFFAEGYELSGVENVSFSYNASQSLLKPLGTKDGMTTHSGPIQQTMSLSRVLTYDDPIFSYTGEASLSGSIHYGDSYNYFNSGYLSDYSLNCAVGTVPKVSCNFQITDEIKKFDNDEDNPAEIPALETHPTIDIPTQGSITIECDNSQTNRVIGFDYAVKCSRKAYFTIGSDNVKKIELVPPIEFTASVQIEVDDAFLQDSYKFLEEKENKTVSISVDGRDGSLIQSLEIPNASLVGENLQVSADGSAKITLNYVGHSAKVEAEAISSNITYIFDENSNVYDSTSNTTLPYEWYKDNPNVYGLQVGDNVQKIDGRAFQDCPNLYGDLYISMGSLGAPNYSIIEYGAFRGCTGFDGTLIIEDGLQKIGFGAFESCSLKGNLVLPDSIVNIDTNAFRFCSGFKGILELPKSGVTIGARAFEQCNGLKGDLFIPDSFKERVREKTFAFCSGLDGNLYLGTGIEILEKSAFFECNKLKGDLIMPPNLTGIRGSAFYGCSEFDGRLTLNSGLKYIGTSAFAQCHQISSDLVIPDSVEGIDDFAFNSCRNLKSLTIGTGVEYIGTGTFKGCSKLAGDIDFKNVKNIRNTAFQDVSGIGRLTFGPIETIGTSAFQRCKGVNGDLILPDSLTSIGASAFDDCQNLDGDLVIGNGITRVWGKTFANTFFDGGLTLGQNITRIDEEAFRTAGFTNQLVLPDSIKDIKYRAFSKCGFTGDLVLHSGINEIRPKAFELNRNIKRVIVDFPPTRFGGCCQFTEVGQDVGGAFLYAGERDYYDYINHPSTLSNGLFNGIPVRRGALESRIYNASDDSIIKSTGGEITANWYDSAASTAEGNPDVYLDVGFGTTEIGVRAFQNNQELGGNIFIPGNVKAIGDEAFQDCKGITGSLYFDEGLEWLKQRSFQGCDGITGDLIFPDSLNDMNTHVFDGCSGLNGSIKISKSLTNLGNFAFMDCYNLTGSINIPSGIININVNSFDRCSGFNALELTDGIETISRSAFRDCNSISNNLIIPNTTRAIGDTAFQRCSSIPKIKLGNSVETIGANCFRDCVGIDTITIRNNVTSLGGGAFRNCINVQYAYIDIPESAVVGANSLRFVDDGLTTSDRILFVSERYYTQYLAAATTFKGGGEAGYYQGNIISIWPDDERSTTYFDANFGVVDSVLGDVEDKWKIGDTAGHYLYIGSKTKNIGKGAFEGSSQTSNLGGTLLLPDTLKTISSNATDQTFARTKFSSIASQEGFKEIQSQAFLECQSIKTVVLPASLEFVGQRAFYKNDELQRLKIGNNETRVRKTILDTEAFRVCGATSAKQGVVDLGYTVDKIGPSCFANDVGAGGHWIETLNSSAREYGPASFKNQYNLTNLNLTKDALHIGQNAFELCLGLTNVVLPNPNNVYDRAFGLCNNITGIEIGSEGGAIDGNLWTNSFRDIGTDTTNGTLKINRTIANVDYRAFYGDTNRRWIQSANLDCRTIGGEAFRSQSNMTDLTFGPNVKYIGVGNTEATATSFRGCIGLTGIRIPDPYYTRYYSFNYCTGITGIYIGNDDKDSKGIIGDSSFRRIGPPNNNLVRPRVDGHVYVGSSIDKIEQYAFYATNNDQAYRYSWIGSAELNCRVIDYRAFFRQRNMKKLTFSSGVKVIGRSDGVGESFYNNNRVKEIKIPDPEAIYYYAFNYCTGITGVFIGNDEKNTQGRIEKSAFRRIGPPVQAVGVIDLYVGSSIDYIGESAFNASNDSDGDRYRTIKKATINARQIQKLSFQGQKNMTGITFGDTVKIIGKDVDEGDTFENCTSLRDVVITDPEQIYYRAFHSCRLITGVHIGNDEKNTKGVIDKQAFRYMGTDNSNGHLYVGSSIDKIRDLAFYDDSTYAWIRSAEINCREIGGDRSFGYQNYLRDLTFGSGFKKLGLAYNSSLTRTFVGCTSLTGVRIPDPEEIWYRSFESCSSITGVYIGNNTENTDGYVGQDGFRYVGTTAQGNAGNGHAYVGSSIKKLDTLAFYGDFWWLYSADINCEEIGYRCFEEQRNLKELTLSSGVKTIGGRAFYNNYALTGVKIPDPTFIEQYAFQYTQNLSGVYIGNDTENTQGIIADNGGRYIGLNVVNQGYLYIGSSIKSIGTYSFYGDSASYQWLKKADINCKTIGIQAFYNQDNLTEINLGENVWDIKRQAFHECDGITGLRIPNPKWINDRAFDQCRNMTGLYIGNDTENTNGAIQASACEYIGANKLGQCHVYVGSSIKRINKNSFRAVNSSYRYLKSADLRCEIIGEEVMGNYSAEGSFFNQTNMTDVSFSSGVKIIGTGAFNQCEGLTGVRIPDPSRIDHNAFRYNHNITGVYVGNDEKEPYCKLDERSFHAIGLNNPGLGHCYLGKSIDSVGFQAFNGYWNGSTYFGRPWLKSADLKCREFGEYAFHHQDNMTGVKFSDDCRVFGLRSFEHCEKLSSVVIPGATDVASDETLIGELAFSRNYDLDYVDIGFSDGGDGGTIVEADAFRNCGQNKIGVGYVRLGRSVKAVRERAFQGDYKWIKEAYVNCFNVGSYSFAEQTNLDTLLFSWGVRNIRSWAFNNCTSLTRVKIQSGRIIAIEENAFAGCPLTEVYLNTIQSNVSPGAFPAMSAAGKFYVHPNYIATWGSTFNGRQVLEWPNPYNFV